MRRTIYDLVIDRSPHLRLEWYWKVDGTMPGRDEFDVLTADERAAFLVATAHWKNRNAGERPLMSFINKEHEKPLILAIKVGSRRFPTFEGIPGSSWIVMESYRKKGSNVTKSVTARSSAQSRRGKITSRPAGQARTTSVDFAEPQLRLSAEIETMLENVPTLVDEARKDPAMRRAIDAGVVEAENDFRLEREIERAMDRRSVNRNQLADLLGKNRSSVSRDLNRGLNNASIGRVRELARALDHEFIAVVIPLTDKQGRIDELVRVMKTLGVTVDDLRKASARSLSAQAPRRRSSIR